MSYAIIRTGGKQFAIESGQTVRVPSIDAEAGKEVEIETLLSGGSVSAGTIKATVVSHGKGDKVIVFKRKDGNSTNGNRATDRNILRSR